MLNDGWVLYAPTKTKYTFIKLLLLSLKTHIQFSQVIQSSYLGICTYSISNKITQVTA